MTNLINRRACNKEVDLLTHASIGFEAQKGNLIMTCSLALPASFAEFEVFCRQARKFAGHRVEVAPGLFLIFNPGDRDGGVIKIPGKHIAFTFADEAVNEFFGVPDFMTLIFGE